jgi:hypothetical protein
LISALLLACGTLAQGAGAPQPAPVEDAAPSAPPKAPIAGLPGFRSRSRIVVRDSEDRVFLQEVYYVFPERVRMSIAREGAAPAERQIFFRFGSSYWTLLPGSAVSQAIGGESIASVPRFLDAALELRRAAMLWPDGLAWVGEGTRRSAESSVSSRVDATSQPQALLLLAELGDDGRPKSMRAHLKSSDGTSFDTRVALLDLTWTQKGERWWPHTFRSVDASGMEGFETIESIETAINALDDFFVPPDRRKELAAADSSQPQVAPLPPAVQARRELPPDTSWDDALALAERWGSEEAPRLAELGLKLQDGLVLELAADTATPVAVLLRLAAPFETVPPGWERIPERRGVSVRRMAPGPLRRSALERLERSLPADAKPSAPYVRLVKRGAGEVSLQLVLPFERAR